MRIAVVGAGYVGLAVCGFFAQAGHSVTCVERDAGKVALLRSGGIPFVEPGLRDLLQSNAPRIAYHTGEGYGETDVVYICVGTPEEGDGSLDVSGVYAAARSIAATMKDGCLIAVKSTVPAGTCDDLERYVRMIAGCREFELCYLPEFLSQGTAVEDIMRPARVVVGAQSRRARETACALYEGCKVFVMRRLEAELVKLASNAYLATRVSFVNELGNLCEALGADCQSVCEAMGADPRIGTRYFRAGAGYGGSCLPKDSAALLQIAAEREVPFDTLRAAMEANNRQKGRLLAKARRYYRLFTSLKAAVLGVSFKPATDDIRNAPALDTIYALLDEGARVAVWDGAALPRLAHLPVEPCGTIQEAIADADVCFIFTEWEQIRSLDVREYARLMRVPLILDGRNCYDPSAFGGSGAVYECIGLGRQRDWA